MPAILMKSKPIKSRTEEHCHRICRMSTKVSKDFSRLKTSQQPGILDSITYCSENVITHFDSDNHIKLNGIVGLRVYGDGLPVQNALGSSELASNDKQLMQGSELTTIFETLFSPVITYEDAVANLTTDRDAVFGEQSELPHLIADEGEESSSSSSNIQSSGGSDRQTSDPNHVCFNGEYGVTSLTNIPDDSEYMNSQIMIDTGDRYVPPYYEKNAESISILDYPKEESQMNVDDSYLFLAIHQLKSPTEETKGCFQSTASTDIDCFDPYLFLGNVPTTEEICPCTDFVPDKKRKQKPVTLVLDLDETLVHSTLDHCEDADFTFPVFLNMKEHTVYVRQRPHLHLFLERVAEMFEIVIFTASQSIYAERLLDILDPSKKIISQRKYRESCTFSGGSYTKDLSILGIDLARVAIIDNSPQVFQLQVNNGIPIKSWFDDPLDCALISLLPFLETLADADDVRPLIAKKFNTGEKECIL